MTGYCTDTRNGRQSDLLNGKGEGEEEDLLRVLAVRTTISTGVVYDLTGCTIAPTDRNSVI